MRRVVISLVAATLTVMGGWAFLSNPTLAGPTVSLPAFSSGSQVAAAVPLAAAEATGPLVITTPQNKGEVGPTEVTEGFVKQDKIDPKTHEVMVVVHPLLAAGFWVQRIPPRLEPTEGGYKFRTLSYFGTPDNGKGEKFELIALVVESGKYKEGQQLDELPKEALTSPAVLVTRVK